MRPLRCLAALCGGVLMFLASGWVTASAQTPKAKEWTVLIFMNGKNDLEPFAIEDFEELAEVGSDSKVNFVVQLGRPLRRPNDQAGYQDVYDGWSGAKRYLVTKGMKPEAGKAVDSVAAGGEVDMGSPEVLQQFLEWGKARYPAKRYAVVVWNHGQGYRLQFQPNAGRGAATRAGANPGRALVSRAEPKPPERAVGTSHRAISQDIDTGSIIYNSDLKASLDAAFGSELRLVGFDACLMAMIETAYELRNIAPVMVASEELEPGAGWNYTTFARALVADATADETGFARLLVESYRENYRDTDNTTLSAIRSDGVAPLAAEISKLSVALIADKAKLFPLVKAARATRAAYNSPQNPVSIDLIGFLNALEAQLLKAKYSASSPILVQVRRTRDLARGVVFERYASSKRGEPHGSYGIAIYFPATRRAFDNDGWSDGYTRSNQFKPIDFVGSERWSAFLAEYLSLPS